MCQKSCYSWSQGLQERKKNKKNDEGNNEMIRGLGKYLRAEVPPAPVRVPSQRSLAPSVASVTSVANKGDNEMILGAVHRSPGVCLTAEENPRKTQRGYRLMKGLCDQSSPQMGSLFSK